MSHIQENVQTAMQISTELASARMPHDNTDETTQLLGESSQSNSKSDTNVNYQSFSEEPSSSASSIGDDRAANNDEEEEEEEDGIKLKKEHQNLPWSKRPSVLLVIIMMVSIQLVSTGIGTSMVDAFMLLVCKDFYKKNLEQVTPSNSTLNAVMDLVDGPPVSVTDPRCFAPEIMATVSLIQTYSSTISAVLTLFTVPLLAAYSDRIGRKPLILLGLVGVMLSDIINCVCYFLPDVFHYNWVVLTGFVEGMSGSSSIIMIMCSSYISDSIKETYRTGVFSVFEAWLYAGLAVGPLLGSFLLELTNRNLPLLFLSGLSMDVLRILVVLVFLQESRSEYNRRKSIGTHLARQQSRLEEERIRRMSTATSAASSFNGSESTSLWTKAGLIEKIHYLLQKANILEPFRVLKFSNLKDKRARRNMYILIGGQALMGSVFNSSVSFMIYYAKSRFNFTSIENNYFLSLMGSSRFFVLALVFPQVLKMARARWAYSPTSIDFIDKRMTQMGLFWSTVGLLVMAEASTTFMYFSSVVIMSLSSCAGPIGSNAIIKHAPKNKVGELLGAVSVLSSIQGIIMPVIFATIYNYTIKVRGQAIIEMVFAIELFVLMAMSCLYVQNQIPSVDDVESMVQE